MRPSDAIAALLQLPGWTETRIAKEVGSTQPTINRIKRGGSPSWATGEAIVDLAITHIPPSGQEASHAA